MPFAACLRLNRPLFRVVVISGLLAGTPASVCFADDSFNKNVLPILQQYCFDCHADGAAEGNFAFDDLVSDAAQRHDTQAWWSVLKNVRADVMPPDGENQPSDDQKTILAGWITESVFSSIQHPSDPGPFVLRRLNRLEYRNTIRDLMGIDFDTSVEFPPDDTGNGFDNNADALSISPLLAEKYVEAASIIVEQAVPATSRIIPAKEVDTKDFKLSIKSKSKRLPFDEEGKATAGFQIDRDADYRLVIPVTIRGSFYFNPSRARVRVLLDEETIHDAEYGWITDLNEMVRVERPLTKGKHSLEFIVEPIAGETKAAEPDTYVRLDIRDVKIEGPVDRSFWNKPDGYDRFFHLDDAPEEAVARRKYAEEVLRRFCEKAFRHPVGDETLDRLLDFSGFAQHSIASRQKTFEQQIARAMTAILASPRFLFRIDEPVDSSADEQFPKVDEYSLASRLSYFLWSTMPDEELFRHAREGTLRANMSSQVDRMLKDNRSDRLIRNFVGQWLQTRDVEGVTIDPLAALGLRNEYDQLVDFLETTPSGRRTPPAGAPEEHVKAQKRYREIRGFKNLLDADLRRDMARETEMQFEYVFRDNRSLLELIDADYTFLNERLARHYQLPKVDGNSLRRVSLPQDSPRGGILTQGTFLLVTSNPSRTSPVKRGLFILDNILGTPAPPAPPMVPELEEAASHGAGEEPTLRELLEIHRKEPLCNSCHARFDPLGLAFENFSAIGTWRDSENGKPIEPGGQLISGESFGNVSELKQVLAGPRRSDFYRCLAERMLAYAIGRSLDFGDEFALDQIAGELEAQQGAAQALVTSVIDTAAFQRVRRPNAKSAANK